MLRPGTSTTWESELRMRKIGMFALAVMALALSACSGSPAGGFEPVGTWGSTEEGQPSLVLEKDGSLHGSDGCNRLMGSYEVDGDDLVFGPLASTMMFCQGVDTWLGQAVGARYANNSLEILDPQGRRIGMLERGK